MTEQEIRKLADETNKKIDIYESLTFDISVLSDAISRVGLYQRITADQEDKDFYKYLSDMLDIKTKARDNIKSSILANKKTLGSKPKRRRIFKNKTL